MKKFLIFLIISLNIFSLANAENIASWATETNSWNIVVVPVSNETENSIPKAEDLVFTYYYWQWCPHCAKLDAYLNNRDWYDKLNIIKKEVWYNAENQKAMAEDIKRLGLEWESSIWVPFIVVNNKWKESTISWDVDAIAYFKQYLWDYDDSKNPSLSEDVKSRNKKIFIIVTIFLAILIPLFLIKSKK